MTTQYFQKARIAATESHHRRAKLQAETKNLLEVFVVRAPQSNDYGWQIRKFGGLVISASNASFECRADARRAGDEALTGGPQSAVATGAA